jgi:uncharacterized membrane protein
VFDRLERVTSGGLALTFVFLGFVSILPFTTSVWGHHIREPLAFVLYFLNQFAMAAVLTAKVELARVKGYLKPGHETDAIRMRMFGMCAIMGTGAATAGFMPREYQWLPVGVVAVATNLVRLWRKRKLARATVTASVLSLK